MCPYIKYDKILLGVWVHLDSVESSIRKARAVLMVQFEALLFIINAFGLLKPVLVVLKLQSVLFFKIDTALY